MEASGGSDTPDPRDQEHFVDKYKFHLIHYVRNAERILEELYVQGVIPLQSFLKIRKCQTAEKMWALFHDLKDVGVEGKDIFYNILEKLEPDVIEKIKTIPVLESASGGQYSSGDSQAIRFWEAVWDPLDPSWPFPEPVCYLENIPEHLPEASFLLEPMRLKGSQMSPDDDWIKLEPEVTCVDAPTYSFQSSAGNFECSVSGLRWVCKEKVSFKYQFGSWEEHMERLKIIQYIAGGPLLDITVIAGKLDDVYLPHWICADDPTILDKFAVLHIDTCGDVVEQVSEVTPSHVKLSHPVFSPRAVLMKAGLPVKINCKVLIYKTNKSFLTLHVYLIPRDPALHQTIENKELSSGCTMIQKPYPVQALKMRNCFSLTADKDGAEIYPDKLKLVYESSDPNFFEVFIENPDSKFQLTLTHESGPVWACAIRKDDFQNTGGVQMIYGETLFMMSTQRNYSCLKCHKMCCRSFTYKTY